MYLDLLQLYSVVFQPHEWCVYRSARYSEMTEHEKKLVNQAPSDPRRRRKNSEPSDDTTVPKKKSAVTTGSPKVGPISFACK